MYYSPTSDKCDKFGHYFCSTYLEPTVFPLSLWAQIPSDARRTNNGPRVLPSAFQCAIHFTTSYVLYFLGWDCKTTNRYIYHHEWFVYYCANYCSGTQTTATSVPSLAEISTALLSSRQQFLRAVGYNYAAVYDL